MSKRFLTERGATLTEYACIAAVLSIGLLTAISFIRIASEDSFTLAATAMVGEQVALRMSGDGQSPGGNGNNQPPLPTTRPADSQDGTPKFSPRGTASGSGGSDAHAQTGDPNFNQAPAKGGGNEEISTNAHENSTSTESSTDSESYGGANTSPSDPTFY